jgi:quinol monooxygenase YgiN
MLLSLIKILPSPEKRESLLGVLNSVQRKAMVISGCKECMVCEESGKVNAVLYMETWDSRESLYRHIRSGLYIRVLHAMDLASQPPEILFYEVSEEEGLDLIRTLRGREEGMQ